MNNGFYNDRGNNGNRPSGGGLFSLIGFIIEIIFEVATAIVNAVFGGLVNSSDRHTRQEPQQKVQSAPAPTDSNASRKKKMDNKKNSKKQKKLKKRGGGTRFAFLVLGIIFLIIGGGNLFDLIFDPAYPLTAASLIADAVIPFGLSALFLGHRRARKNYNDRCDMYLILMGDCEYFSLSALAAAADVSLRCVRRDIRKMISDGELGASAYLDRKRDILFMSPEAGAEYDRLHEEVKKEPTNEAVKETPAVVVEDEKQVIDKVEKDEYREIILEIRRLNDEIADIAVSERIYKIEEHTQSIFDYVKEHPEKKSNLRTFMNYYLPTTLKLLTSYAKIERVGAVGDNMKKSKEDIEKTLDLLVYAFGREVDMLFESESIDISSDIDVLETMLRRDGMSRGYSDDITQGGGTASEHDPFDLGNK